MNENSNWDFIEVNLGDHKYFHDDKAGLIWITDKEYEKGNWGHVGGEVYYKKSSFQSQTFKEKNDKNALKKVAATGLKT